MQGEAENSPSCFMLQKSEMGSSLMDHLYADIPYLFQNNMDYTLLLVRLYISFTLSTQGLETNLKVNRFSDRACMFQDRQQGRMFCEFSATQLRQLQGVYHNFTSTSSSDGCEDNGRCYIMPKLQKLLNVLRKSKYSLSKGEGSIFSILF